MAISLPNFPPFEVHLDGTAGLRWKKWLGRFERLTIRMGISDDKQKRALLLHCSGSSTKSNLTRPVPSHPLLRDLESLFGGISKVKGKVIKLHIDPDVISKQQPHRRISFQVRKNVEMELKRLEELDIIETVTGPTPWVSLIVIVPKRSGQVRICVDMREANKTVKHLMPTIDDLVADLNGATVFSKLELSSGYHQLELAPESRCITTFSTHVGLRRYKRLMFGINAAPEILQSAIEYLWRYYRLWKNSEETWWEPPWRTETAPVTWRAPEQQVCAFSRSEIKFYGQIFSKNGVKADPAWRSRRYGHEQTRKCQRGGLYWGWLVTS